MYRCSFVRTPEEIEAMNHIPSLYDHRKTIHLSWGIPKETYERLLPPGLDPADIPSVYCFVSVFSHAGFNLPAYNEAGLFLPVKCQGINGAYCLAMPIQGPNEMGILMGREGYNYPKKAAKVQMDIIGDRIHAVVGRNGIDFFELEGTIGEKHNHFVPKDPAILGKPVEGSVFLYQYKLNTICEKYKETCVSKFDNIKLVEQCNFNTTYKETPIKVHITMRPSPDDPWIEVAPTEIYTASFADDACEMKGCRLIKEFKTKEEIDSIVPYLVTAYDLMAFGYQHEIHW